MAENECEHCGAPLQGDSYFCGSCGKATIPAAEPRPGGRKQTMIGVSSSELVIPAPGPDPAAPSQDRTTDVGISEPPPGAMGRTIYGMGQPSPPPPAPASEEPPQPAAGKAMAKTMLGMPGASQLAAKEALAAVAAQQAEPSRPRSQLAATLLGAATPQADSQNEGAAVAQATASAARKPDNSRTVLGLDSDAEAAEGAPKPRSASRPSEPRAPARSSSVSVPGMRRPASRATLALALVSLVAAAALGVVALRGHGPDVRVHVVTETEGESMVFEVPGALSGAKLRFGGQDRPIEAGRATFPLAQDSLRVGKNVVLYDVISASGKIESGRFTLAVESRVTLDLAPLRAGRPQVDVVVAALPGSKVFLDGQPIALDSQGRAVRSDTLDLGAGAGDVEHLVRYKVEPPSGEPIVGDVRASIAVTSMQIDSPGADVVTDHDAIEVAGAVDKDTKVTIDGRPIEVRSGRFLERVALPEPSSYRIAVQAMAPGKAPRVRTLSVERVESLAKAAEGFDADHSLSYAKIASNPAMYAGQKVAFEGRVYNVQVEGGRSALQVLVRECPRGERCPLWVSYPGATELKPEDWVRVLGVVQGEQQFRSEAGETKRVPKVEAVFLLPAKP